MPTDIQKHIAAGPKVIRYGFFVAGIVATIAYRITPFLDAWWVKVAWYVGSIGFFWYLWHCSHLESKRAQLVEDSH